MPNMSSFFGETEPIGERKTERQREAEFFFFLICSCDGDSLKIQNLQSRPAVWTFQEEMTLNLEFKEMTLHL